MAQATTKATGGASHGADSARDTKVESSDLRAIAAAETMEIDRLPPDQNPPDQVGPYGILGPLGRGGMGVVFRAKVVESCALPVGREVALKMLKTGHLDERDRRRFTREANYLQALNHPGIVRVYDVGEVDGKPYLIMELVEGRSLDEFLAEGKNAPLPEELAGDVVIQALEALHAAHIAGITHRDLKPGNLMINSGGRVKVLDFGMAQRVGGAESRLTASGSVLGTPAYMSPEQARGAREDIGPRADVYGMGAVLYELVTGKQPYQAENSVAMLRAILEEPLTPPSEHRPDLNRDLETILLRALAKDQRDRYPNAEAMAADLRRQRRGQRVRATRIGWWKPLVRRAYYHRRAISVIALVAFILSMATYLIVRRTQAMIARQNERIEETIELEARLEASWLEAWRHQKDLEKGGGIAFESAAALGEGLELLRPLHDNGQLVSIPSALRGRFVVTPLAPDALVEFLFADRAVGLGYGLRLVADPYRSDTWMLQLLRARSGADAGDRAIVASATVDQVSLNSPTRINISREDNTIVASVDDVEVLRFVDLVPYEGPQHNRVGFLLRSGSGRVSGAILERQRRPELISRLELADSVRQDGRFERAVDMYREFLADFPASERARDARYRIGLCLVALERDGEALEIFSDVAEANVDDPPYYIAAMFQSWGCALRLERYDLAEQYYGAIRNRFEVDSLLAAIPQETIADLPKRYLERALRVAEQDPTSAFDLFETAAEIALFLRQTREAAEVIRRAANLLYLNGQLDGARERLLDLVDDPRLRTRDRILARMRLAEIERELGDEIASQHHYTTVINDPQTPRETRQWAHLWLGDLLLHQGRREEAELNWVEDDNRKSLPGQIMHNLLVGEGPLPLVKDPWFANDVAYFNAVWHGLRGDEDAYRAALRECAEIGDPDDWPTIHAERRLDDTVPAIFITPGTDFFEP